MLLKTETYKQQSNISQYCRDGKEIKIKGARQERLPHYRRLVFNVVKDSLATTYPIARKYINSKIWDEMVYTFFSEHKCRDPQVWKMPNEFYRFCVEQEYRVKYELPFLNDLLLFEWMEVEVYMMEDIKYPKYRQSSNWLKNRVAVNPEHRIFKLDYPVHLTNPEKALEQKGDYYVLLYREKESGRVQFINLSALFVYFLENISQTEKTTEEIFNDILYIFGINDLEMLQTQVFKFLEDLKNRGFVLGVL